MSDLELNISPESISNNTLYSISRVILEESPDITNALTSQINSELLKNKSTILLSNLGANLPFPVKVVNIINSKIENLKTKLIPFALKLLEPFGTSAIQAVVNGLPIDDVKNLTNCPSQSEILRLINRRNKLATQINNIYKIVTTLTKIVATTQIVLAAIQAGAALALIGPPPLPPNPPLYERLKEDTRKVQSVLSIITITLVLIGLLLGIILRLLSSLDSLLQQCSQDQDIPFETINEELNNLVNTSTGISNSTVIDETQQKSTYKGFVIELKLDEANVSKYPRRYAQALNNQGVPVLKTDLSFASDPQVLIDQLKFIIDSNPNLTAE